MSQETDYNKIGADIGALVTEKNAAYGNSFAKCGEFLRLLFPEGCRPDQFEDALAMVRIFDKQMRIATRKDAFGESPYRDIAGYGILGATKDERYAAIHTPLPAEEVAAISAVCGCIKAHTTTDEVEKILSERYDDAAAISEGVGVLDLSLPSITLPGDKTVVWAKFCEERTEWAEAVKGSMEELVELWDCIQALQTYNERGGDDAYEGSLIGEIAKHYKNNRPVMEAKKLMLCKNASRMRATVGGDQCTGYYSPETCAIIIESGGTRWK